MEIRKLTESQTDLIIDTVELMTIHGALVKFEPGNNNATKLIDELDRFIIGNELKENE